MSWWSYFRKRWLLFSVATPLLALFATSLGGFRWWLYLFVLAVTYSLILLASTFGRARQQRSGVHVSVTESLARARPALPPLNQIDTERPLIGIVTEGRLVGEYAIIYLSRAEREMVGGYAIMSRNPLKKPIAGFRDAPIDDLRAELRKANIAVLPQSKYSDTVKSEVFARVPNKNFNRL